MGDVLSWGKDVIKLEGDALYHLADILDEEFEKAVDILSKCERKVVISGMGKSGHIARKIAATMTSTGTPAVFFNPAEGAHGDVGIVETGDVLIAISKSGETEELLKLIPFIKRLKVPIISITNKKNCSLAEVSDVNLVLDVEREACPMNLAPTTSTTVTLALGDALAVALMREKGFSEKDFALLHPGGLLGKQLLKVKDLMQTQNLPLINKKANMKDVISTIISHKRGVAIITDDDGKLTGIIVDGDLKRILMKYENIMDLKAEDVMTKNPKTIDENALIAEALNIMEGKITSLIIVDDEGKPKGLLHIHDILTSKAI